MQASANSQSRLPFKPQLVAIGEESQSRQNYVTRISKDVDRWNKVNFNKTRQKTKLFDWSVTLIFTISIFMELTWGISANMVKINIGIYKNINQQITRYMAGLYGIPYWFKQNELAVGKVKISFFLLLFIPIPLLHLISQVSLDKKVVFMIECKDTSTWY